MATGAHQQFVPAGDDRFLAAVLDTEAQIALAGGSTIAPGFGRQIAPAGPRERQPAGGDGGAADRGQDPPHGGRCDRPRQRYAAAAELARAGSGQGRLRDLLGEWADLRAEAGDFQGAYELTSEAVRVN